MSSYRTQAISIIRDPLNSGLPHDRRQHWTELPGWVTAYVREKTEIGKKHAQNSHIYDILCNLWKVPKSFAIIQQEEEQEEEEEEDRKKVFLLSEATIRSSHNSINSQGQILAKDMLEILEFLIRNTCFHPKRLGWLNPNLHEELSNNSNLNDWIMFPAPDFIHWLSDQVPKTSQKLIRHIPHSIPCKIAVFGNLNPSSGGQLSAASMQFSQVWHRGIFLTMTSRAAASNPHGLKKLISKLIKRQYDNLGNSHKIELSLWLSLHTYWLLSPPSISEGRSNASISSIRAFNQIHNPDLPNVIPIINQYQMEKGIKEILNEGKKSIHLMETNELIKQIKIPRIELNHFVQTMLNIYHDRSDDNLDEVHSIIHIAIQLLNTFWLFRINLIVVDPIDVQHLNQSDFPSCQFITFETLFELMSHDFSE